MAQEMYVVSFGDHKYSCDDARKIENFKKKAVEELRKHPKLGKAEDFIGKLKVEQIHESEQSKYASLPELSISAFAAQAKGVFEDVRDKFCNLFHKG